MLKNFENSQKIVYLFATFRDSALFGTAPSQFNLQYVVTENVVSFDWASTTINSALSSTVQYGAKSSNTANIFASSQKFLFPFC